MTQQFNLVSDPWIKVIESERADVREVSLIELFENAAHYRRLAGEMRTQDLVIVRFLLAILHTVYSRVDVDGQPYPWLSLDAMMQVTATPDPDDDDLAVGDDLMATWQALMTQGRFSAAVGDYLRLHQAQFDFFGEQPFYQATNAEYDRNVPAKKAVETGSGRVGVRQMNRTISESGNTPGLFSPKSVSYKDSLGIAELVRWVMTYQNYTGVTDKSKIVTDEPFSNDKGWLYQLDPVFANGESLFETLMLNLVLLDPADRDAYHVQRPVWELSVSDYLAWRRTMVSPDNLAALYTTWSRLLTLQWDDAQNVTIYSAGIPSFPPSTTLLEPMTVWRYDKKATPPGFKPATKDLRAASEAMWRHFGRYVNVEHREEDRQPGLIGWLGSLELAGRIPRTKMLELATTTLISDGNATSQAPAAEVADRLTIKAAVLFDPDPDRAVYWPARIMEAVNKTQTIGKDYWVFVSTVAQVRGDGPQEAKAPATAEQAVFYAALNEPFRAWLEGLTNDDDRDVQLRRWYETLRRLTRQVAEAYIARTHSPRDRRSVEIGSGKSQSAQNVFTAMRALQWKIDRDLELMKEVSHDGQAD